MTKTNLVVNKSPNLAEVHTNILARVKQMNHYNYIQVHT